MPDEGTRGGQRPDGKLWHELVALRQVDSHRLGSLFLVLLVQMPWERFVIVQDSTVKGIL